MKKTLLLLSAAAAFTLGSCSENKPVETTTATTDTTITTTPATSTSMDYSTEAITSRADRMANDMATSMKFDEPTRMKVRDMYVTRGQRMNEMNQKYMTDTMGMAAARRDVYANTDTEMKTVFTDPKQYSAYESGRNNYYEDRYMDNSTMNSSDNTNSSTGTSTGDMDMSKVDKMKIKGEDGGKLKVSSDGDVKMKDADGNKAKMDSDDGTIKMKPENGDKTVIK